MGVTPGFALPYPERSDLGGNFPAAMADLAADVDAALGLVVPDSGLLSMALTPAAGWSVVGDEYRIVGPWLFFDLSFERTGANLVANAQGNIADELVATIDDPALRPAMTNWVGLYRAGFTGGGALINGGSGNFTITSAHSTSTISTGDDVVIGGVYSI